MLNETARAVNHIQLFVWIVWIVILLVNLIFGLVIGISWKSWKTWKEDQKELMQKFIESHQIEHKIVFSKIVEINKLIDILFEKKDLDHDSVLKLEGKMESSEEKIKDHIRRCEKREQCHDKK